jgi:DNA-binding transcriptional MocR family regulator
VRLSTSDLTKEPSSGTLYDQVAERIEGLIDAGTLEIGTRIPSVRKLSVQLDVSVSTVLAAYRLLEDRGVIESRPQSGYYVRVQPYVPPAEPEISKGTTTPQVVSTGQIVMKFLSEYGRPGVVPLGAAMGAVGSQPLRELNRIMASIGRRAPVTSGGYDIPPGCAGLRAAVARRSLEAGCALSPDSIVTTNGSQEAMNLCLRAVAKPGDTIAVESPTYYGILQIIESLGMKALEIPTHPRDGISLDALRYALDHKQIKACLFCLNFSNPMGSCMPDEAKRELVEMLGKRRIPLIEDDVYGDLTFVSPRPRAAKAFDKQGLVLLCSSFSKTLAPGYRVGWCAPGVFFDAVAKLKVDTSLASATLPQMAVAEFLATSGYEHHLRKVRRVYQQQVERMTRLVCQHFPASTRVTRPQGGFLIWVELPAEVDSWKLHEQAISRGISIAPGAIFSAKPKYPNFIRLNCGVNWTDAVDQAIATLGGLIRGR